jgi:4-hydroxy-tetrahydrodipicolinate synthase
VNLSGVHVPLITPFDNNGVVDTKAISHLVEVMIANGISGIVAAGTTGEAYALNFDERQTVTDTIRKQVNGRVPVLAGVGGMSTREAIKHAQLAVELKCDGLMVAAPAYVLPTPSELAIHVTAVIAASKLPTVLYDYPARTGVPFDQESLDALADNEYVIGIKEASGDLDRIPMLKTNYAGRIEIVCGADADSPTFFDAGVTSWIGGMANALPKAHFGIMNPDTRQAAHAAVLPLLSHIESGRYIAKTKALMGLLGVPYAATRGPLLTLEPADIAELQELVAQAGEWAPSLV